MIGNRYSQEAAMKTKLITVPDLASRSERSNAGRQVASRVIHAPMNVSPKPVIGI
ncbi:hypothetical protein PJL18_03707 [Paenarthrobacter nicotinovorans]|nr:hypothetical protein [Paenarthrobacter nicotinovorans]